MTACDFSDCLCCTAHTLLPFVMCSLLCSLPIGKTSVCGPTHSWPALTRCRMKCRTYDFFSLSVSAVFLALKVSCGRLQILETFDVKERMKKVYSMLHAAPNVPSSFFSPQHSPCSAGVVQSCCSTSKPSTASAPTSIRAFTRW